MIPPNPTSIPKQKKRKSNHKQNEKEAAEKQDTEGEGGAINEVQLISSMKYLPKGTWCPASNWMSLATLGIISSRPNPNKRLVKGNDQICNVFVLEGQLKGDEILLDDLSKLTVMVGFKLIISTFPALFK